MDCMMRAKSSEMGKGRFDFSRIEDPFPEMGVNGLICTNESHLVAKNMRFVISCLTKDMKYVSIG
jgi:hypothetical protein